MLELSPLSDRSSSPVTAFQSWMEPPVPPVASNFLSGAKTAHSSSPAGAFRLLICRALERFSTVGRPSGVRPKASRSFADENSEARYSLILTGDSGRSFVLKSQILIFASIPPLARYFPSGDQAIANTAEPCPLMVLTFFPVAVDQTLTVRS